MAAFLRNFSRFLFYFFVAVVTIQAQAQMAEWKFRNPLPQGNRLKDVFFVNSQTGWSVGFTGTILKTTNAGTTWQLQNSGTFSDLTSVHFLDAQNGWVAGADGTVIHTTDGGDSWQMQNTDVTITLNSIVFTDTQTGWAAGALGSILKTTDGGNYWVAQTSGTNKTLSCLFFLNNLTGWASGNAGTILKTVDGGITWASLTSGIANGIPSICFVNTQTGWVCSNSLIKKTTDGGSTWNDQISNTNEMLNSIQFLNPQTGWAIGSTGVIRKTTNGGMTWSGSFWSDNNMYAVYFVNAQNGYVVGEAGTILKSTNGGTSWSYISPYTYNITSLQFTSPNTAWANCSFGPIIKSTTGGIDWFTPNASAVNNQVVFFWDDLIGWASKGNFQNGYLISKTTDGGITWMNVSPAFTESITSICFVDSQIGWITGSNGLIRKTTDGGNSWTSQTSGISGVLSDGYFTDSQNGWVLGSSGRILKTTNGGISWTLPGIPLNKTLQSIFFINPLHGWVCGDSGSIYTTLNGGISWTHQPTSILNRLNSIRFDDDQIGLAVGTGGIILKTTNGGASWIPQMSGTHQNLVSLCLGPDNHGWASGSFGTILSSIYPVTSEGPTSGISGTLFRKNNADCNPTNMTLPYRMVKAVPGPYYSISDQSGNYYLRLPVKNSSSNYSVEKVPTNPVWLEYTVCPTPGPVSVPMSAGPQVVSGIDFGSEVQNCHMLDVQIHSDFHRPCRQNFTVVRYVNKGNVPAPDAWIIVDFPHWIRPISASRPHIALNDSTWRFNLNTVASNENGFILIVDSVVCGHPEIIGLTQCTRATIFPANDCIVPNGWNGADLTISGSCNQGVVRMAIRNIGQGDMMDSTDYSIFMDSILVRSGKVRLQSHDSLVFNVNSGGMTVTISANQVPNHPYNLFVTNTIQSCANSLPPVIHSTPNHFPISHLPNSKKDCPIIRSSYDPNIKLANPIGFTENHVLKPGTEMDYKICFQNTGNDTAFTVYVIDSLDHNLNPESFIPGTTSHPCRISLQTTQQGRTYLRFQFDNIYLPDSNTNELLSHGFFTYRISPKSGIALGSQVKNKAAIYFDFNPPVITNQTLTTFDNLVFTDPDLSDSVFLVTPAATDKLISSVILDVYPNPFTNTLQLKTSSGNPLQVSLCNLMGKELKSIEFLTSAEFQLANLPAGIYYLKVPRLNKVLKVIKQ